MMSKKASRLNQSKGLRQIFQTVILLTDHSSDQSVGAGKKDEDGELDPSTEVSAFQLCEKPARKVLKLAFS